MSIGLTQHRFDSLVSFAFNLGLEIFKSQPYAENTTEQTTLVQGGISEMV